MLKPTNTHIIELCETIHTNSSGENLDPVVRFLHGLNELEKRDVSEKDLSRLMVFVSAFLDSSMEAQIQIGVLIFSKCYKVISFDQSYKFVHTFCDILCAQKYQSFVSSETKFFGFNTLCKFLTFNILQDVNENVQLSHRSKKRKRGRNLAETANGKHNQQQQGRRALNAPILKAIKHYLATEAAFDNRVWNVLFELSKAAGNSVSILSGTAANTLSRFINGLFAPSIVNGEIMESGFHSGVLKLSLMSRDGLVENLLGSFIALSGKQHSKARKSNIAMLEQQVFSLLVALGTKISNLESGDSFNLDESIMKAEEKLIAGGQVPQFFSQFKELVVESPYEEDLARNMFLGMIFLFRSYTVVFTHMEYSRVDQFRAFSALLLEILDLSMFNMKKNILLSKEELILVVNEALDTLGVALSSVKAASAPSTTTICLLFERFLSLPKLVDSNKLLQVMGIAIDFLGASSGSRLASLVTTLLEHDQDLSGDVVVDFSRSFLSAVAVYLSQEQRMKMMALFRRHSGARFEEIKLVECKIPYQGLVFYGSELKRSQRRLQLAKAYSKCDARTDLIALDNIKNPAKLSIFRSVKEPRLILKSVLTETKSGDDTSSECSEAEDGDGIDPNTDHTVDQKKDTESKSEILDAAGLEDEAEAKVTSKESFEDSKQPIDILQLKSIQTDIKQSSQPNSEEIKLQTDEEHNLDSSSDIASIIDSDDE